MNEEQRKEMFAQIMRLRVGESLVFLPGSALALEDERWSFNGNRVFAMRTRRREGHDAGRTKFS